MADSGRWQGRFALRVETAGYAAMLLVLILPQWTNRAFLTQDGPMHLHNARLLLDHLRGAPPGIFADYYDPNISFFPYWFGHLSLAFLLAILPPLIAEKVFLSSYIVLSGFSLRLLLAETDREATFLAFLGLPLICTRPFQRGSLAFSFSVVFLLLIVRFWLRHESAMTYLRVLQLTLLFLTLYFCHPITYLVSISVVSCLIAAGAFRSTGPALIDEGPGLRSLVGRLVVLLLAILPSLLLFAAFFHHAPSYYRPPTTTYGELLRDFLEQGNLALMTSREAPIALAVSCLFLIPLLLTLVSRFRAPRIDRRDGFLLAAVIALALHLYGSLHLSSFEDRMQFMPLLLLLAWFGTRSYAPAQKIGLAVAACGLVLALTTIRFPVYARASAAVAESQSVAAAIADRSTVLPLIYSQFGLDYAGKPITDVLKLFLHVGDYVGAGEKQIVILSNIGGLYPQFPYRWRADRNPFTFLATNQGLEGQPPSADLAAYAARTGGSVDYVIVWGLTAAASGQPAVKDVLGQLARGYERVLTSPSGLAVLYRRAVSERPAAARRSPSP